ncbi:hypothetical protein HY570_03520, partial [Candidatus Micrarchaeota archaeon]|nr:hypothetical protein [Candidatus Micrarchaeota archaeon]
AGRFDKIIELPLPDKETRVAILKIHTKNMPLAKNVDLDEVAKKTDSYTGADMEGVCREAGMCAIRENVEAKEVGMKHFEAALQNIKSSITKEHVERIKRFKEGEETMYR